MKKNEKQMKKVSVQTIINAYKQDNNERPKNAQTNNIIIEMLENASVDFLTVEINQNGTIYNRGSVAECLGRACVNEYVNGSTSNHYKKSTQGHDLSTNKKSVAMLKDLGLESNKAYEFKLISGLARASYDNKENADNIIMIDIRLKTKGVYLVNYNDLVLYNGTSIKDYKGQRLDLLCELLGL